MAKTKKPEVPEVITFTVEVGGNSFNAGCLATDHEHPVMIYIKDATFTNVNEWVIKGMPGWVNVSYVIIENSTFYSLDGLGRFPRLEHLEIYGSLANSMAGVEACTGLKKVFIKGCHLDNMAWVAPLDNIEILDLTRNDITRIEGVAGKQHLKKLYLGENKIASTAGLEDLPAIRNINISKNAIADIPNPVSMVTILGQCHRMHEPGGVGFNDTENPFKKLPAIEKCHYFTFYYKQRFETLVPELEHRLAKGETVGMDFFKDRMRIEDIYYPWYGDQELTPVLINAKYNAFFIEAERYGLDVNFDIYGDYNNNDVLEMRPVEGSRIDLLISTFKHMVEGVP